MITASPTFESSPIGALVDLLGGRRVFVLGGAGCSTESGIPDYRGPEGTMRGRKPMQYQEFVGSERARARYWSRSAVGWPRVQQARPNACHDALARLEAEGTVQGLVTQNVDGLHQQAGSRRVVELHGSLGWVRCLGCGERVSRDGYQERLLLANPVWARGLERAENGTLAEVAPDGDAELRFAPNTSFRVPPCERCGGVVKPDVVFFGENVPAGWVEEAWRLFQKSDVLLVVGSSLTVYSGRRFVYRAQKEGVPIGVVNLGPTRADDLAAAKVDGRLGTVLPRLADALIGRSSDPVPRSPSSRSGDSLAQLEPSEARQ